MTQTAQRAEEAPVGVLGDRPERDRLNPGGDSPGASITVEPGVTA